MVLGDLFFRSFGGLGLQVLKLGIAREAIFKQNGSVGIRLGRKHNPTIKGRSAILECQVRLGGRA